MFQVPMDANLSPAATDLIRRLIADHSKCVNLRRTAGGQRSGGD